ncbi:hypothetical protein MINTM008_05090 [Mycobacterium intracellulare]|nr:hypothetical protein MINTM008_05090 [Mycobacterium intracellulare]BCO76725.1 hypothetical protein MINTM009_05070 [Mycobacterium intracellulare]BCP29539.1 hypothetical protein MINTM026_05090 [Mycobacterium intracellulare]BCP40415.1 hypothetical protein MINTMi27_05080 [Mycobacterium intracellulare]
MSANYGPPSTRPPHSQTIAETRPAAHDYCRKKVRSPKRLKAERATARTHQGDTTGPTPQDTGLLIRPFLTIK